MIEARREHLKNLNNFIGDNRIRAFPEVLITPDFDLGFNQFLQATSIGPIKPNLAIFGWSSDSKRAKNFVRSLKTASLLNMSNVLVWDGGLPISQPKKKGKIDIWWRGKRNGSLMVILAHLLSLNPH